MVAQTLEQWHEILQYMALVGETRSLAARKRRAEIQVRQKERAPQGALLRSQLGAQMPER